MHTAASTESALRRVKWMKKKQSAPSGSKVSVWVHFGFHCRSSKHIDRKHAVCRHSHPKLKYCGNMNNLRAHISRFNLEEAAWVKDGRLEPVLPLNQRTLHEMTKLASGSGKPRKSSQYLISCDTIWELFFTKVDSKSLQGDKVFSAGVPQV